MTIPLKRIKPIVNEIIPIYHLEEWHPLIVGKSDEVYTCVKNMFLVYWHTVKIGFETIPSTYCKNAAGSLLRSGLCFRRPGWDGNPDTRVKELSSFYGELNSLRYAISQIPLLGSYIDATLAMPGQKYVEERLEYLICQLQQEIEQVKEVVVNHTFLQTEERYDLLLKTFIAAARTRQREKLNLFAKVLRGAYTYKDTPHDPELYIKIIDELSETELAVALLLYNVKVVNGGRIESEENVEGNDAHRLSKYYPQFTCDELEFILPRLEKTGLIKEIVGSFLGYAGGEYMPTAQLSHFINYIESNQ